MECSSKTRAEPGSEAEGFTDLSTSMNNHIKVGCDAALANTRRLDDSATLHVIVAVDGSSLGVERVLGHRVEADHRL
jgi:hypothetical protein